MAVVAEAQVSKKDDAKLAGDTAPEKYVFPKVEGPGVLFIDPNTHVAWLGVSLSQVDYLEASAILDDSKYKLFAYYKQRDAQAKIHRPSGWQGMKTFLHKLGK